MKLSGMLVAAVCFTIAPISEAISAELPPVRGVVKSGKEAVLTVEFVAKVTEAPIMDGEAFSKDDTLMVFDCEALVADQKGAKAALKAARSVHNNNLELQKHGAIGEFDLGISEANMQEAKSRSDAIIARSKNCVIKAPFNGRVAELAINRHETTSVNQPLLKIVGTDDLELKLIVPSAWLAWLKVGDTFGFEVDETASTYSARVDRIGAEVDAVSRTIPIVAKFTEVPGAVLPGMSGTARFESQVVSADQ